MPAPRAAVPSYRLHKSTGQAVVTIRTPDGGRRDIYLGAYNSDASKAEYARLIARRPDQRHQPAGPPPKSVSVAEVLLAFLKHAATYYVGVGGKPTGHADAFRIVARAVRGEFAALPAAEFGPRALASVRDVWVEAGIVRREINRRTQLVRQMFRWAASQEMIPASVPAALATLAGLAKGRTTAPEPRRVLPVDSADALAVLPHVRPEIAGMIEVQLHTGMRPGEVCLLRPADVDRSGAVWLFRTSAHKGTWRDKDRVVAIGPKAQAVLLKFWPADPAEYVFSPARSLAAMNAERAEERKTPRYPSHMRRNAAKRKAVKARGPAVTYTHTSYQRAVTRGIGKGNAVRKKTLVDDPHHGPNLPIVPGWAPNQLRHTHGTLVRKRFGLEAAQVVLGHSKADVTQVYAEKNLDLAAVVAAELG